MEGVLDDIGWIQDVIVNERTGFLVDGHLRVALALSRKEATIPVKFVDLSETEELEALATFDPIAALATTESVKLKALMDEVNSGQAGVQGLLADLAEREGLTPLDAPYAGETIDNTTQAKITLAERFIVPPFSVLDARQGYWKDRKRAWIALGIQSELGRGENTGAIPPNERDKMSRSYQDRAAPGGTHDQP